MSARRILATLALSVALGAASGEPALAAKVPPAPPQIITAVAINSRTVDLSWTAVKGADHYVVSTSGVSPTYTTATSMRVTDLYPGDEHVFYVSAETRKNQPLGTSEWVYVATPPEGPMSVRWAEWVDGYVRLFSDSGIGCVSQELGVLADDATGYISLGDGSDEGGPRTWIVPQASGTTETYAVRCQGAGGLWSPWSEPPTVVTLP